MTTATPCRPGLWAAASVLLAFLGRMSVEIPPLVEWHRTTFFPRIAFLLQWMSGSVLVTIGEVGAILATAVVVAAVAWRPNRAIGHLFFGVGSVILSFYALWGLAYRYPSLGLRIPSAAGPTDPGLAAWAEKSGSLVARASARGGVFDGTDAELLARLNAGLFAGFLRLPRTLEAAPVGTLVFGPVKPSRLSLALSWLQLSGYYFPWTGEAQLNVEMPRSLWPRVAAHEKAHQRGFARENEATVIGVLACLSSPDPTVAYSGSLGLFVGFDRDLAREDPEARRRIWAALPGRALEDLRLEAAFWKVHEGVAGTLSEKANDTYLKAQGVRSGVGSYSDTTRLFLQALDAGLVDLGVAESPR